MRVSLSRVESVFDVEVNLMVQADILVAAIAGVQKIMRFQSARKILLP